MTITTRILQVLSNARNGLNAFQIREAVNHSNLEALHSNLCRMVKKGYVKKDGIYYCECCGLKSHCYRITQEGRIKLHVSY